MTKNIIITASNQQPCIKPLLDSRVKWHFCNGSYQSIRQSVWFGKTSPSWIYSLHPHHYILCHLLIVLGDTTVISRHSVSVGVVGCHVCEGESCCAKGALDNWRHSWGSSDDECSWISTHWAVEPIRRGWSRRCWRSCWSPRSCSCSCCLQWRSCNCPCSSPNVFTKLQSLRYCTGRSLNYTL